MAPLENKVLGMPIGKEHNVAIIALIALLMVTMVCCAIRLLCCVCCCGCGKKRKERPGRRVEVAEEDPEMESSIEMTKFDIQNDALNEDPLTIPDHDPSINDEYGDDVFEDPTATPGEADGGNATAEADGGAGEGGGGEDGESDVMDLDDVEEV